MVDKSKQDATGVTSIGIDIGKDVFHMIDFDPNGKVVLRRKFKRLSLEGEFKNLPRCMVGMETCLSAHFVSRRYDHSASRRGSLRPRYGTKRGSNRIKSCWPRHIWQSHQCTDGRAWRLLHRQ